jgi:hypothetical protein
MHRFPIKTAKTDFLNNDDLLKVAICCYADALIAEF